MKKLTLTLLALLLATTGAFAAKRNFKVAASNVDGLPPVVHIDATVYKKDISMNPDGSQEPGATRMGELFGESLWDIVALSEDFNYHSYIMAPIQTYYNASTYRGKIEQSNLSGSVAGYLTKSVYMKTDGLCLLTRKKTKVLDEQIVRWNEHYGYDDHEADGLIDKGYRFYQVNLEGNLTVDVYIMHMDAGSDQGDIDARTSQLKQVAAAIIASKNNNPIIILGDTNCRYTRDNLKADLIDAINADSRFDIHDPWVDFMWDGVYPEYGTESIMTHTYGEQKGEVVDKVFYINNKESACTLTCNGYLHDDTFTYADGSQIADHFPVVADLTIEGPDVPAPPSLDIPEAPVKGAVVSGSTYYIRNLGTGEFVRAGGNWTTQAIAGDYGSRITLTNVGGDSYTLSTTHQNGSSNHFIKYDGSDYYMDQSSNNWTLTQVYDNVYTLKDADGHAVGMSQGKLVAATENTDDKTQMWEFLTNADLLHELYYASSSKPKNATFLMKDADFGYNDKEGGWTISPGNSAKQERNRHNSHNNISYLKLYNTSTGLTNSKTWKLEQKITGVPAGTYKITYKMLSYNLAKVGSKQTFTINGDNADWDYESSDPTSETVAGRFADGKHSQEKTIVVTSDGAYPNTIYIYCKKDGTSSATGAYFDDFNIKCIGLEGMIDQDVYDRVKVAIDDAQEKADEMGIAFNNRAVETLWSNYEIVGDGWNEVKKTYKNLAEAVLKRTTTPCDYTNVLLNPSFELYPNFKDDRYNIGGTYPFGWDYPTNYAFDSGVWPATDQWKKTTNPDGKYIYNTWENGETGGYELSQETSLTPGIYELTAKVTSAPGNTVCLSAAGKTSSVVAENKEEFTPITLHFEVENGQPIKIGVYGKDNVWYKADDFHLTRIGAEEMIKGLEMLQLAINDAKAKSAALGNELDLSKYQALIDNYTLEGDGSKEFYEIYTMLREMVYAKGMETGDMTDAIINNSFEWGENKEYGWDLIKSGDTGARENSNSTYNMNNNHGAYLFNTWSQGTPLKQTIYNLPAGHYKLQARAVTGDTNVTQYMFLLANGNHSEPLSVNLDKKTWSEIEYEFDVAATANVEIGIVGGNSDGSYNEAGGQWYKADYFRLTRMGEPQMQGFYDYLQQVIDWTTAQVQTLPAAYVAEWDMSEYQTLIDNRTLVGDGKTEAAEIYAKMRALVLSQTEPAADMTLAITNNSFEMGDMTGWSCSTGDDTGVKTQVSPYITEGLDGTYIFNTYSGGRALAVTQTLPALRAGKYELKALVCSDKGNKYFLAANDQTQAITISEDNNNVRFEEVTLRFKVAEDNTDVVIGVYPAVNGEFVPDGWGAWYKADNFRLSYVGTLEETIVWTMRGDTYDTLILPFDAEIPEGLTAHVAAGFDTSIESTEYHVIDLQPVATLLANTAYVMQRIPQAAEAQYSQRAALPRAAAVDYEFTGVPVEADGELTTGLLTGTLTGTSVEQGHYVLIHQDANSYFNRHEAEEAAEVEANHAYIAKETLESVGATNPVIHFAEPVADNPVSVSELNADEVEVSVYTATGVEVRRGVKLSKAFEGLDPGFYILSNGKRVILK